jgi:hypothetical protein
MLHRRRFLVPVVVALVTAGAATGTVLAHHAAGDPPPLVLSGADQQRLDAAPVAPMEKMFRFRRADIPTAEAARRDLACVERRGQTTCYASEAEMERVERLRPSAERHTLSHASMKSRGRASAKPRGGLRTRAANHGGNPMSIWEHSGFHGWRVDTNTSCQWFNLPDGYSDQSSSVRTGGHYGYLAEHTGGGGAVIGWSAHSDVTHLSSYAFWKCGVPLGCEYKSWNDEASSRKRAGC